MAHIQSHPAGALALALRSAAEADANRSQYLIFSLGSECFAIGILSIREIIECKDMTGMPMMPEAVRGVINLRGAVVPVIDLAARFGRGRTQIQRRTCVVIVEVEGVEARQIVGVLVDSVNEVIEILNDDIEEPPSIGMSLRTDFIAGIAQRSGRFVIVLDVGLVLSLTDISESRGAALIPSLRRL